jgi:hypothetical protein
MPLSKVIGSRMLIGFFRSRRDPRGGHVTISFAQH